MYVAEESECEFCGYIEPLNLEVVDAGQIQNGVLITWQQLLDAWDPKTKEWYFADNFCPQCGH